MSEEIPAPRRILHLVIDDFPPAKIAEMVEASPKSAGVTEVVTLTTANARAALDLVFAADTVAVWGQL